jgi:hypothetical protein
MTADTIWRRTGRGIWWIGVPIVMLGWLLAPRERVIYVSAAPFSIEVNTLGTAFHPILGEWFAGYRITAVALVLLVVVTMTSHFRRTGVVRTLSLLLPAYVAAIEACFHFSSFGTRHNYTSQPTLIELHHSLRMAAVASILAVAAALLVAAVVARWCRRGVADPLSWRLLCAVPPLGSVVIIWSAADRIFFG